MAALLLLLAALAATLEIASRLPLVHGFRQLADTGLRAGRVLRYRRGLEIRKARALRRLSLRMMRESLRAAELLILVALPLALLLALDAWLRFGAAATLLAWDRRLVLVGLGACYAFLRFRIRRRLQPS